MVTINHELGETRNLYNFIKQLKTVHSLDIITVFDIIIMEFNTPTDKRRGPRWLEHIIFKLQVWCGNYAILYCVERVRSEPLHPHWRGGVGTVGLNRMERRRGARGFEYIMLKL